MSDHPLSLQGVSVYSFIHQSIFKAKCNKTLLRCPLAKNSTASLKIAQTCLRHLIVFPTLEAVHRGSSSILLVPFFWTPCSCFLLIITIYADEEYPHHFTEHASCHHQKIKKAFQSKQVNGSVKHLLAIQAFFLVKMCFKYLLVVKS